MKFRMLSNGLEVLNFNWEMNSGVKESNINYCKLVYLFDIIYMIVIYNISCSIGYFIKYIQKPIHIKKLFNYPLRRKKVQGFILPYSPYV